MIEQIIGAEDQDARLKDGESFWSVGTPDPPLLYAWTSVLLDFHKRGSVNFGQIKFFEEGGWLPIDLGETQVHRSDGSVIQA